MVYKTRSRLPGFVQITFELPTWLWAAQIAVVGDFNGWDSRALPMHYTRQDKWQAEIDLPIGGRYNFCYWVDGRWLTDYRADSFTAELTESPSSTLDVVLRENRLPYERAGGQRQWTLPAVPGCSLRRPVAAQ